MSQPSASSQEDSGSQRKAAPRFTHEERALLTSLVDEHKHVVECKKTDVASLGKKNKVWIEIARLFNSNHGVTRRDQHQLKKCWNNMKQKSKEEAAKQRRDRHKTGGGSAPAAMSPLSEQVVAIASHISTRIQNEYDSDGANDLPPVESLPVMRLLQPMVDGSGDTGFDYTDDDNWEPIVDVQASPADTIESGASTAAPEAAENSSASSSATQPDNMQNIIAGGCFNASAFGPANRSTAPNTMASADNSRIPRGRMALLKKSLEEENSMRASLFREEHDVRIKLLVEDHQSVLEEREKKKIFEENIRTLELQQKKLEMDNLQQKHKLEMETLKKNELEIEILEIERNIKLEQLKRLREAAK